MVWLKRAFLFLVILVIFLVPAEGGVHQGTRIWDTNSLLGKEIDIGEREKWEVILPPDREHAFQGDIALENERLLLLFSSGEGSIFLHSKETEKGEMVEIILLDLERTRASSIHSTRILKNSADKITLEVSFLTRNNRIMHQVFSLGRERRWVEINPRENAGAVQIHTPTRFTIIPAFGTYLNPWHTGDYQDVVFNPRNYPTSHLLLPSKNIILNLLEGGERMVSITWPSGEQRVRAFLGGKGEERFIEATEVTFAQQSIYVGILAAVGIWHEVELKDFPFLEDIALGWKRPFPAGWKANFYALRRSFSISFRTRFTRWLPEEGHFVWPAWFEGEKAKLRLNKKVIRDRYRDIVLIYPLTRDEATPIKVDTPGDIIRQTLEDELWKNIRARGKNIPFQVESWPVKPSPLWACAGWVGLERLFERGLATEQAFLVDLLVDGVIISVANSDLRMIEGYRLAIEKIKGFISVTRGGNPAVNSFLERMKKIIQELEKRRYETQFRPWLEMIGKEATGWEMSRRVKVEHALKVGEKIKRLAREEPVDLPEFRILRPLLGYWMLHEPLSRRYLRYLQQEVIIVAAESGEPEVMRVAEEIRRLAREARRNPGWGL